MSNLFTYLINVSSRSLGASSSCLGLAGSFLMYLFYKKNQLKLSMKSSITSNYSSSSSSIYMKRNLTFINSLIRSYLKNLCFILFSNFYYYFNSNSSNIDHPAHLFGFLCKFFIILFYFMLFVFLISIYISIYISNI